MVAANSNLAASLGATINRVQFGDVAIGVAASLVCDAVEKWEPIPKTPEIWTPVDLSSEVWQDVASVTDTWSAISPT